MKKLTLIAIICLLVLTQIPYAFANDENVSKEIERTEIAENCKTIYYKDGSKEVFVTCAISLNFAASATVTSVQVPSPPVLFPIDRIMRVIEQILKTLAGGGVGGFLLAWRVWTLIKGLRRGRPRDYRGVEWYSL